AMLGTTPDNVFINDMAVNPISHNIYVSVSRGRGPDSMPVLMRVTKKGAIEEVPLSKVMFSKTVLSNPPKPDAKTEWGEPERPMTITHMVYSGGELSDCGFETEKDAEGNNDCRARWRQSTSGHDFVLAEWQRIRSDLKQQQDSNENRSC